MQHGEGCQPTCACASISFSSIEAASGVRSSGRGDSNLSEATSRRYPKLPAESCRQGLGLGGWGGCSAQGALQRKQRTKLATPDGAQGLPTGEEGGAQQALTNQLPALFVQHP